MIVYENEKIIKNIKKNGIGQNDKYSDFKIRYLMYDLCTNTSYRKGKIINIVKDIAEDYFQGLPDDLITQELESRYETAKDENNQAKWYEKYQDKTITLYNSEMETIASLQDDKLMRLAFASLVVFKYKSQFNVNGEKYKDFITACDADIYRLADFDKVSYQKRRELWKQLHDKGLVEHKNVTNRMWKYKPDWKVIKLFSVTFNVDLKEDKTAESVYKTITNYDDTLLYLDYYLGKEDIVECIECGCPILNNENRKKLCSNCAENRKKSSKKAYYARQILPA